MNDKLKSDITIELDNLSSIVSEMNEILKQKNSIPKISVFAQ